MAKQTISTVLLPVDGSEGSMAAARLTASIAPALGATIEVLYAFPRDALEMFGPPMGEIVTDELRYMDPKEFAKLRDERSGEVFAKVRAALGDLEAKEVVLPGHPAEAVLEHAKTAENPMIIVGSRGLSRFSEFVLGSVSQKLVHHAKCPVTIARH